MLVPAFLPFEDGGIPKGIGGHRSPRILHKSLKDQRQTETPDVVGRLETQHVFPQNIPQRTQVGRLKASRPSGWSVENCARQGCFSKDPSDKRFHDFYNVWVGRVERRRKRSQRGRRRRWGRERQR